ncbi:MAG TPA: T9SS type A sorting domain-containing protein [Bacteroidia bacterium]|nr:T9SS type A sorting domain-containing protein [Bacteroidia bacterium]
MRVITYSIIIFLFIGIVTTTFLLLDISTPEKGVAQQGVDNLSTGDVICRYTWEEKSVLKATEGPAGIKASKTAFISGGGKSSSNALNPGKPGQPVNLMLTGSPYFNVPGIDIAIDFRRSEGSGNFFTRGSGFNFGMAQGNIVVAYRIENGSGGFKSVNAVTNYTIPIDEIWRTYRFIYSPITGKGEIFVNSVIVWSNQSTPNTKLYWNDDSNIVIGKDMDGGGAIDRSIFDNLVVRSTGSVESGLQSLLAFSAFPHPDFKERMLVTWTMIPSINDNYFTVERSVNGLDFNKIGTIKVAPAANTAADYTFTDLRPVAYGITYYRIKHYSKDGQFVQYPATAVSTRSRLIEDISIENIAPLPFTSTFDLTYTTSGTGEVLMKLIDKNGTVCVTEKMNAAKGKNIHVFRNAGKLTSGIYTLNLTYNNKSVHKKVIKS